MNPLNKVIDALANRGCDPKTSSDGFRAFCPTAKHSGQHKGSPELSIAERADGGVSIHCHAGCDPDDVVGALGLSLSDLFPKKASKTYSKPTPEPKKKRKHINYMHHGIDGVSRFPYKNAEGSDAICVIRKELADGKKTFSQWESDGKDGWFLGLDKYKNTLRPLFCLSGLIDDKKKSEIVIIHEGEKCVVAAYRAKLKGVHTTSSGGAGGAKKTDWQHVKDRVVYISPDNNEAGEKYLAEVLKLALDAGAVSVCEILLPNRPAGGDVVDWLDSGGTTKDWEQLMSEAKKLGVSDNQPATQLDPLSTVSKALPMNEKALSGDSMGLAMMEGESFMPKPAQAEVLEWGEPEPLTTPPISAPDFTENCMPKIIWDVSESSAFTAATSNIFSIPTVIEGVLLALGGRVYVSRHDGSVKNLVTLYLANIAGSGEGKSATRNCLECEHVTQYIDDRNAANLIEAMTWKDEHSCLLDEKNNVIKAKAKTDHDKMVKSNDIKKLNQLIADHHKTRPLGAIIIMAAKTPEATVQASEDYHYIMVSTDEGSAILEGYGRYSGAESADLNPDLIGYDGGLASMSLKGKRYGGTLRQGMNISIQPCVADSILGNPKFSGRGLVQRFTWLASESTAGTLDFITKRTRNAALMNEWGDYILKMTMALDALKVRKFVELNLSKEADRIWAEYANSIQKEIKDGLLIGVESFFNKRYPSLILRIAGLFHCVAHGCEGEIDINTIKQAISFCKVVKAHRLALLKSYSADPARSFMLKLVQKLHETNTIKITARGLQRKQWSVLKTSYNQPTVAEVDSVLNKLVSAGYARVISSPKITPKKYEIHPDAIELAEPEIAPENTRYSQPTTDNTDKKVDLPRNEPENTDLSAVSVVGLPYSFKSDEKTTFEKPPANDILESANKENIQPQDIGSLGRDGKIITAESLKENDILESANKENSGFLLEQESW